MKTINFKKLTVSALAIAMGAGLAGAISGTFAWYQYSTRSTVAIAGTSVSTTKNLKVSINGGEYASDLKMANVANALGAVTDELATARGVSKNVYSDGSLKPVTTKGTVLKTDALTSSNSFFGNPTFGVAGADSYTSSATTDYIRFNLTFKNEVKVNNGTATMDNVDVYLENVTIRVANDNPEGKVDLSKAVRVHLAAQGGSNALIAKEATSTDTNGKLDLNGDTKLDAEDYRYEWDTYDENKQIVYGAGTQASYAQDDASLYPTSVTSEAITGGFKVDAGKTLTVTIWLEGWEKFGDPASAIWDPATFAGAKFNVGLSFICHE